MNSALEKILTIMEDGSIENTLQALELALSLGLEDEVLKKIPPLSYRPSDINIYKLGGLKNLPKEIIRKLYKEAMAGVQGAPIYLTQINKPADRWIFEKLLFSIAENTNTPKDILIELASYNEPMHNDGNYDMDHASRVRFYLSLNKNLPEEALMILVNDTVDDIRERAKQKLGGGIMKESKLILTHKDIKQIINEELKNVMKEMMYPGGHPDADFLRNIRRQEAGIDSMYIEKIKAIEDADPKMARELAISLGSQESSEIMPNDPKNVMQIKSQILELHKQIVDIIYSGMDTGEDIDWSMIEPLRVKRDDLQDKLSQMIKQRPVDIEDWRNQTDTDRREKLRGQSLDKF